MSANTKMQKYSDDFQLLLKDTSFREGTGISNLDGRLWKEVGAETARFFGDEAMVRARIGIEARYLIALSQVGVIRKLSAAEINTLKSLHNQVTPKVYLKVRKIEATARHDVIAMTLIMKNLLTTQKTLNDIINSGWIHWGLASEDVDNLAKAILITNFIKEIYLPSLSTLLGKIVDLSQKTKDVVILGKTHLQTAIPTTLGKEIALFGLRLAENFAEINKLKLRGKLTGAVGNLAAHRASYPKTNWQKFSCKFIESLGLEPNLFTTQIEPKARMGELFQIMQNVNSTLIDMSQDMRLYIGFDWLSQEARKEEFGSSAMPQKINPIDFENSQGNALFSNWILEGLIRQLPLSWLQRDLVDKTIQRNLGLPFGYSLIALISAGKGVSRVKANEKEIKESLEEDWGCLSEAFQTLLRAEGLGNAYEALKELTRGKKIVRKDIEKWIEALDTKKETKKKLSKISHESYIGYAKENCRKMIKQILLVLNPETSI